MSNAINVKKCLARSVLKRLERSVLKKMSSTISVKKHLGRSVLKKCLARTLLNMGQVWIRGREMNSSTEAVITGAAAHLSFSSLSTLPLFLFLSLSL